MNGTEHIEGSQVPEIRLAVSRITGGAVASQFTSFAWTDRLKRVITGYDSCPKVFRSAVAFAATVMLWL
ncbi:hypothetical protein MASR2M74_26510 [Paracoccaceae bacterium]